MVTDNSSKGQESYETHDPDKFIRILTFTILVILFFNFINYNEKRLYSRDFAARDNEQPSSLEQQSTSTYKAPWGGEVLDKKYYYNSRNRRVQEITDDTEFIVYNRGEGVSRYKGDTLQEIYISTEEGETLVGSLSPNGKYFVYTTAIHIKKEGIDEEGFPREETIESSLKMFDTETRETIELMEVPNERTFTGVMLWDEGSNYFYYKLRSSSVNLHFPDPETTEFYLYNLEDNSNRFLGTAAEFTYQVTKQEGPDNETITFFNGHASIFAEDENKSSFYVRVVGQGTNILVEAWKVNKETLEKTNYYDDRQLPETEGYNIKYYDSKLKRLVLEKFSVGSTERDFAALNLVSGEISSLEGADFQKFGFNYLDEDVIYTTPKDSRKVLVLDRSTAEFLREFDVSPHNIEIYSPVKTEDGRLAFRISNHDKYYGIYELNTGKTTYVERFESPFDTIYRIE